ncbi:MAG: GspH/FimT family pseudopilin [Acidiferrobacterales bacterium]|nr:GspH/FimT family pseudopilin [Acidiferrobacterales bacterium]
MMTLSSNVFCSIFIKASNIKASNSSRERKLRKSQHPYSSSGYSLLETLFTLAIVAIMVGLATPSFAAMIAKTEIDTSALSVHNALILARSNAISRGRTALVCPLASPTLNSCENKIKRNKAWAHGWQVFVDMDGNNDYSEQDILLYKFSASKNVAVVFNQNGRLRFFSNGSARSAGFYICSKNSKSAKHVKLLYSGRARTIQLVSKKHLNTCKNAL